MPELPEVEIVRAGLDDILPGKTVKKVDYNWEKSFPNAPTDVEGFLVGAKINAVRRRAKVLLIDLDTNYSLVIHLKMTGQLVYRSQSQEFGAGHPSASLIGELPDKSTRVEITFDDNSHLYFNDQRKFGWMRLIPTPEIQQLDFFKKVGPEPLSADFTAEDFAQRLEKRKNSGIKAVLLDQSVIAGVGNIYADESLWSAKIHPLTKVMDIPLSKVKALYKGLQDILALAIKKGGSSARNYVDAKGKRGSYLDFANVFNRTGQPCNRCGTPIIKTKVAGRGTHICPNCQKAPY